MSIKRYELLDLTSSDGPSAMINEHYDGEWYNREQVQAELQRRLGYGDLESCIQKANSWNAVAALLDELIPDWKCRPDLTRCDEALEAIRGLKARIAELESEQDDDQLLNKYAVCLNGAVTQHVYSRVNSDAQSVYERLVGLHHYNPDISVHFVACEVERHG